MRTSGKLVTVFSIALLLSLTPALSAASLAASPADGTFTFSRQGGTVQWTIFNPGDDKGTYKVNYYGPAGNFLTPPQGYEITDTPFAPGDVERFGSPTKKQFILEVEAGGMKPLYLNLRPPADVEYGKVYDLYLQAQISKSGTDSSSGVGMTFGVGATFNVIFENKAGPPTIYQSVDVAATEKNIAERRAKETNWLLVALLVIIVLAILISVYYFYKKKREEEE